MSFGHDIDELVEANADGVLAAAPGWERVRLGSVARIINGFAFQSKRFGPDGYPLVRIRDVVSGRSATCYEGPIPQGYWVEDGDLLVGMDGDFNSGFWKGGRALLNQRVCRIVTEPTRLRLRFLAYLLPGYLKLLNAHTSSVTVKHLSSRTLEQLPIPLPDVTVQDAVVARIEALFGEIDEGEAALAEARVATETYRQALLRAAVTGELGQSHRLEIHVDQKPEGPFNLPSGWTWVPASHVIADTTYGTSVKCDRHDDGVPVIRMGNIQIGRLKLDDLKYAPRGTELPDLQDGDILFNRTNSAELLGKTAVYRGEIQPCSFASYIVRVRLKGMLPDFFAAWMNSIFGRAWIAANKSQQVGQANLSAGKLRNMPVPLPPREEQVDAITQLNAQLELLRSPELVALPNANQLRQSILAAAFRGDFA